MYPRLYHNGKTSSGAGEEKRRELQWSVLKGALFLKTLPILTDTLSTVCSGTECGHIHVKTNTFRKAAFDNDAATQKTPTYFLS
jgi:hypothetical protein